MTNPGGVEGPCGTMVPKGWSQTSSGDLGMQSLRRLLFRVSGLSETSGSMLEPQVFLRRLASHPCLDVPYVP